MEKQIAQFFKDYPGVNVLLVAGDQLFLPGFEREAARHAAQKGVSVETATRPEKKTDDPKPGASKA